ncbi:MAG: hypothetical protein H7Y20_14765 [Bryobacteraceae bacterium]|nr:hypothetical protein [Bryobacteraceae bacterium]
MLIYVCFVLIIPIVPRTHYYRDSRQKCRDGGAEQITTPFGRALMSVLQLFPDAYRAVAEFMVKDAEE